MYDEACTLAKATDPVTSHEAARAIIATGEVSGTRKFYRDRLGRFAANPTARAMKHVIAQWVAAGIDRDSDDDVLAVTGG